MWFHCNEHTVFTFLFAPATMATIPEQRNWKNKWENMDNKHFIMLFYPVTYKTRGMRYHRNSIIANKEIYLIPDGFCLKAATAAISFTVWYVIMVFYSATYQTKGMRYYSNFFIDCTQKFRILIHVPVNFVIIGSGNDLAPNWRQVITWSDVNTCPLCRTYLLWNGPTWSMYCLYDMQWTGLVWSVCCLYDIITMTS